MRRSWILLLVLGLAGCATMPGRSARSTAPQPAEARPADTGSERQIHELKRQAAMASAEIKLLRRQLAALQVEVERLSVTALEPRSTPATRAPDPPLPRPRLDEIESSDLEPIRVEPVVAAPPRSEPMVVQVDPQVERQVDSQVPGPRAPMVAVPLSGQSIYDSGYTLYHQGRFVDAESSFQRFLQAHGDTELADNAQFWIGESRFAREDFMGALLAFQEVLDRYPGGNKVADAMLKVGDCLLRMDKKPAGLLRYEEVMRRFPGSAAAAMAEERLSASGG